MDYFEDPIEGIDAFTYSRSTSFKEYTEPAIQSLSTRSLGFILETSTLFMEKGVKVLVNTHKVQC